MDKLHLLSDQDVATGDAIPDNSYYKADTPSQPWASAPPEEMMDAVPGYEGIGASGGCVPPPAQDFPQTPSPEGQNRSWQIPSIGEEMAKEAFLEYVSSKCCYRSNPAKQMSIMDMHPLNTYRYRLVTFTETRSMDWATEPYNGGIVDGGMGHAPGPWDIAVSFSALFEDASQDIRVPYTSTVKGCESCLALGRIACTTCTASGYVQCSSCGGLGRVNSAAQPCPRCSGVGRVKCTSCSGIGTQTCNTCKGKRQLVTYLKLTVKWKNNVYESVANKQSGFPTEKLSQVTGDTVFSDIQPLVYPVIGFPDNDINRASNEAVRLHQAQFCSTGRILQQKQTIELIPITRVHYCWKEKTYIYFVYGVEHRVLTDDYPGKCLCCSIL
uniref:Ssu-2 homolog, tandem duplicate 4 n=2 Tax=Paramormyrops kingsleyae TaxID=1676925 RepID=A0A3B3SB86_9TELE|nr:protein SSUH2 homolog [Paramormyrops kingsleyae]